MKMKKLFSIATTVTLLLGSTTPTWANEAADGKIVNVQAVNQQSDESEQAEKSAKITKDAAKEIAVKALKDSFDLEMDDKKYQSRIGLRPDYMPYGNCVWEVGWDKSDNEGNINIQVGIDGINGSIVYINTYRYNRNGEQSSIATITEDEAKKLAENFIKKINPTAFEQIEYVDDSSLKYNYSGMNSSTYNFYYIRKVNGIPFPNNHIRVSIDGRTALPISFDCTWDEDLSFPDAKDAISKEKALEIFNTEAKMTLMYVPVVYAPEYNNNIDAVRLVYTPSFNGGSMVDAKTGKMMDYPSRTTTPPKTKNLTQEQKELLLQQAKSPENLTQPLDSNDAETLVNSLLKEFFEDDYEIQSLEYTDNSIYMQQTSPKAWSASFHKKGSIGGFENGGSIQIDASSGRLLSIQKYSSPDFANQEDFTPSITWEEAYDKAINIIGKHFPDKLENIKTEQTYFKSVSIYNGKEMPERGYSFHFPKVVNGLLYSYNYINVEVDAKTGKISGIHYQWTDNTKFPSTEGIMTEEEALKKILESNQLELCYITFNEYDHSQPKEVQLIYKLVYPNIYGWAPGYIDAVTGTKVDYNGKDLVTAADDFQKKIAGHWAEKQLQILASQHIIDKTTFELESDISLIDFLKMLVKTRGYEYYMVKEMNDLKFTNITKEDADYLTLQLAVKYGLIENSESSLDKTQKVTREEMAKILVKLLGYDHLANAKGIFTLPYEDANDVSPDKLGYVAICTGLEILSGSDGKFHPKANTSMAEAAATVYKALGKIQNIR